MPSTPALLGTSNSASKLLHDKYVAKAHNHSCPQCPYRAYSSKSIEIHISQNHTETKKFKCPHCTYSAHTQYRVDAHLKLHENTDSQSPQNDVAPESVDREPTMPPLRRRPLSNIGNDSSASQGEIGTAHGPAPQRVNSAVASSSEEKEKRKKEAIDKGTVAHEVEQRRRSGRSSGKIEVKEEEGDQKVDEEEVERRTNAVESKTIAREAGQKRRSSGKKDETKKVDKKEMKAPEIGPRTRRSMTMEKKEDGTEVKKVEKVETLPLKVQDAKCALPKNTDEPTGKEKGQGEVKEKKTRGFRPRTSGVRVEKKEEGTEEKKEEAQPVQMKDAKHVLPQSSEEKTVKEEGQREEQKEKKFLIDSRPHKIDCHLDSSFTEDEEEESDKDKNLPISVLKEEAATPLVIEGKKEEKQKEEERMEQEEKLPVKEVKRRAPKPLSEEEKARRAVERRNRSSVEGLKRGRKSAEEKEPVVKKKVTVAAGNKEGVMERRVKEEEREDEGLAVSLLDAAIAEAEANAEIERTRPPMPVIGKMEKIEEEEKGPTNRKRVHWAPLPEKHHALHMPTKKRKMSGEKGDGARSTVGRGLSSPFFPFNAPSTSYSSSSPDRNAKRASIIEAMRARESQLEQRDRHYAMVGVEKEEAKMKMPFSLSPFESHKRQPIDEFASDEEEEEQKSTMKVSPFVSPKRQPIDEFASDEEEEEKRITIMAPLPPVKPAKKTPARPRKPTKTTVSTIENGSRAKKRPSSKGKTAPVKIAKGTKAAATAARKKEQARVAKLLRLKRDLAGRLEKSADRKNSAARAKVEEEDRYWRAAREVTPLERKDWSGEKRLFSWTEIHHARRKMAIDVEPRREGEKRVQSLHSVSTSAYLARSVDLNKRSEVDGIVRVIKTFDRARTPPLDWSYEEKETEEVLHPTVPSRFVSGGELRCI